MKEQFEKLPEIAKIIPKDSAFVFSEEDNCYFDYDETRGIEGFINGAWYAFQEQQKIINIQECGATEIRMILEDSEYDDSDKLERISELLE